MRKIFTLFIVLLLAAAGVASAGEGSKNDKDEAQKEPILNNACSVVFQPSTRLYFIANRGDVPWKDFWKITDTDPFYYDTGFVAVSDEPFSDAFIRSRLKIENYWHPISLEINEDTLYVADREGNRIVIYNLTDSVVVKEICLDTVNDLSIRDICFGPEHNLYVSCKEDSAIYKVNPNTDEVTKLQINGEVLVSPGSLLYEPEFNRILLVAQRDSNSLIQSLNLDSLYLTTVMNTGINRMTGITKDENRNCYYVSSYDSRIKERGSYRKYLGGIFRIDSNFSYTKFMVGSTTYRFWDIYYNNITDSIAVPLEEEFFVTKFFEDTITLHYPTNGQSNLATLIHFKFSPVIYAKDYDLFLFKRLQDNTDSLVKVFHSMTNSKIHMIDTTIDAYIWNFNNNLGIETGQTYTWCVTPIGDYDYVGTTSTTFTFTTADTLKPGPRAILPPDSSTGLHKGILIEWQDLPGTEYYNLRIWNNNSFNPLLETDLTSNTFDFFDYEMDKIYQWCVYAHGPNGGTIYSDIYRFTTGDSTLGQVKIHDPYPYKAYVSQDPLLKWHPVEGAQGYLLRFGEGLFDYEYNADFYEYFLSNGTDTTYQLSNLNLSATYSWGVRAYDSTGDGAWSEGTYFSIVDTVAGIPEILPLDNEYIYPEFVWKDCGADSYRLEVSEKIWTEYPYSDFFGTVIKKEGIVDTKYKSEKPLLKKQQYVWRVGGKYNGKYSYFSEPDLFTIIDPNSVDDAITGVPLVSVIPNPVYDLAEIRLRGAGAIQAEVYNSIGELVTILQAEKSGNENSLYLWNTKNITSGLYFIRFNIDGKVISKKVSVVR